MPATVAVWILVSLAVAVLAPLGAFVVGGRRFWAAVEERAPEG